MASQLISALIKRILCLIVPKIVLTGLAIKALRAAAQTDYWDAGLANFGLRVGPRKKTFLVLLGPKRQRVTIGHYPEWSLPQARRKAMVLLGSPPDPNLTVTIAFAVALEGFLAHKTKCNRPSTIYETERLLRRHFPFRGSLSKVTTHRIMDIVGGLPRSEANHAFVAMRTFLNWCVSKRYLNASPLAGVKQPYRNRSRDRALEDHELASILQEIIPPKTRYDVLVGLLITTGQRRNEIGSLRPEFIDRNAQTITLPATITKNNTKHTFPYGPLTAVLLERYEFCDKPFNSWNTIKRLLEKRVVLPHYTLHDFRRTLATIMSRENLAPITAVEALLNHQTGSRSPIQRIYDRHDYMPQMRDAVLAYDAYLSRMMLA